MPQLLRRLWAFWRFSPRSGRWRTTIHFLPLVVPHVIAFICGQLYLQSAFSFLTDRNAISTVSIYERLGTPAQQILGGIMLGMLLFAWRFPNEVALYVILVACGLRGYDSIHLHSIAGITVYGNFLAFSVPALLMSVVRRHADGL